MRRAAQQHPRVKNIPAPEPPAAGGDSNQSIAHKSTPSNCWLGDAMRARRRRRRRLFANVHSRSLGRLIYLHLATSTGGCLRAGARLSESVDSEPAPYSGLQRDNKYARICAHMCVQLIALINTHAYVANGEIAPGSISHERLLSHVRERANHISVRTLTHTKSNRIFAAAAAVAGASSRGTCACHAIIAPRSCAPAMQELESTRTWRFLCTCARARAPTYVRSQCKQCELRQIANSQCERVRGSEMQSVHAIWFTRTLPRGSAVDVADAIAAATLPKTQFMSMHAHSERRSAPMALLWYVAVLVAVAHRVQQITSPQSCRSVCACVLVRSHECRAHLCAGREQSQFANVSAGSVHLAGAR